MHSKGFSWRWAERMCMMSRDFDSKPTGCLHPGQPQKNDLTPSLKTSKTCWRRSLLDVMVFFPQICCSIACWCWCCCCVGWMASDDEDGNDWAICDDEDIWLSSELDTVSKMKLSKGSCSKKYNHQYTMGVRIITLLTWPEIGILTRAAECQQSFKEWFSGRMVWPTFISEETVQAGGIQVFGTSPLGKFRRWWPLMIHLERRARW